MGLGYVFTNYNNAINTILSIVTKDTCLAVQVTQEKPSNTTHFRWLTSERNVSTQSEGLSYSKCLVILFSPTNLRPWGSEYYGDTNYCHGIPTTGSTVRMKKAFCRLSLTMQQRYSCPEGRGWASNFRLLCTITNTCSVCQKHSVHVLHQVNVQRNTVYHYQHL